MAQSQFETPVRNAYDTARKEFRIWLSTRKMLRNKVFIAYRQLEAILKSEIGWVTAKTQLPTYNHILKTLKTCLATDKTFSDAIDHFRPLQEGDEHLPYQMETDSKILLATAHGFIELYLSPDDKRKAIGFHA